MSEPPIMLELENELIRRLKSGEIKPASVDHFYLWGYICARSGRKMRTEQEWANAKRPYHYDIYCMGWEDGKGDMDELRKP